MTATLERTKEETRMAKSWTVSEVLDGWARYDEALVHGRDEAVRLPVGKQSRYYKQPTGTEDLDFGAWTRVNRFARNDAEIVWTRGNRSGRLWDALAADLARCPYPCEAPSNDPPMPSLPESVVLRHRRLSEKPGSVARRLRRLNNSSNVH